MSDLTQKPVGELTKQDLLDMWDVRAKSLRRGAEGKSHGYAAACNLAAEAIEDCALGLKLAGRVQ